MWDSVSHGIFDADDLPAHNFVYTLPAQSTVSLSATL